MKFVNLAPWFNNLTIRRKLVFTFLVITILPLGLLAYLSNRSSRLALTQAANNAIYSVALETASSIDTFISINLEKIRLEAQFPAFRDFLSVPPEQRENSALGQQAEDALYNLYEQNLLNELDQNYFLGFTIVDRSTGKIVLDTHASQGQLSPYLGLDWSQRSYYVQPALLGIEYSSPVEISQETGDGSLYFSARITNELNQPVGVLIAHFDVRVLQDIITQQNNLAGEGSFGAIFDENLIHLAHGTNPDLIFTTVRQLDENLVAELQRTQRLPNIPASDLIFNVPELQAGLENTAPFFSARDPETGDRVNQAAVVRMESKQWQVVFFQPELVFLQPVQQQTANILLFSVLISLLSLGAAFLAAQGLGTPIARLTTIAGKVAAGDLTAKAEVTSKDEIGVLADTFNDMTAQLRQTLEGLEQRITERTNLLHVSSEVGRAASSVLNPDELIHRVVNLITDRFGFYYAAIFLIDDLGEWADLKDATGEAGKALLARRHRLPIGGQNMVGTAITSRQARIALDAGQEMVRYRNPLLPETRSEIALPLIVGDQAMGALDVQSTQAAAFTEQDIDTLQNMANQVAIAIQNARLYQQAQHQLTEISRLNQVMMREGWQSFLQDKTNLAFQYKHNQLKEIKAPQIPELENILREQGPIFNYEDHKATLTLPLVLRDQTIGILHLKADKNEWSSDDLSIINTVTRQAVLAFENARLVEAAQQLAIREQQINQITSHIRNSADLETILKTTLAQLATALNVPEAHIQLSRERATEKQNGNNR